MAVRAFGMGRHERSAIGRPSPWTSGRLKSRETPSALGLAVEDRRVGIDEQSDEPAVQRFVDQPAVAQEDLRASRLRFQIVCATEASEAVGPPAVYPD